MSRESFTKFLDDAYTCNCFKRFFLKWRLNFRVSSKYIRKCFCQLAQKTDALLINIFWQTTIQMSDHLAELSEIYCSRNFLLKS